MTFREATEAVTSANYRAPKTILGFFAIVLGILASSTVVVVGILVHVPVLHRLVIPVLLFAAAILVAALAGVLLTAWKDPTILMLGQVTGEVYLANRRLTLGDSTAGEFAQLLAAPSADRAKPLPKDAEAGR